MPQKFKTDETGVFYRYNKSAPDDKIYYVVLRVNGSMIEQRMGAESEGWTPPKCAIYRTEMKNGNMPLSKDLKREKRKFEIKRKGFTFNLIWRQYQKHKSGISNLKRTKCDYEKHINPVFGHKLPANLSAKDVEKFKIKLLKDLEPSTVKKILRLLVRLTNFGFRFGWCQKLDFQIDYPKITKKRTSEFLDKEQSSKLIKAIKASKDIQVRDAMLLALYTGMRRGECFGLEWSDIHYEDKWIKIRNPKPGPDQSIPLNTLAEKLLKNHPETKGTDLVFPDRNGKMRTEAPKESLRIRDAAGLPKSFRAWHGLRHSYASAMASSGKITIFQLQKLLRHASIVQTMIYAHLMDSDLQNAAAVTTEIMIEDLGDNGKD